MTEPGNVLLAEIIGVNLAAMALQICAEQGRCFNASADKLGE